jgi:hypothetical protein
MSFRDHVRGLRVLILLFHLAAASVWIFVMPGGFPVLHLRFLANRALPLAVIAVAVAGILAARKRNTPLLQSFILALAAGWGFASLTGLVLFPISGRFPFVFGMMATFGLLVFAFEPGSGKNLRAPITLALCFLAATTGALAPRTQQAEPATTRPLGGEIFEPLTKETTEMPWATPISEGLRVNPSDESVTFARDRVAITVRPLLTFLSRSPDRCWTLIAPHRSRMPPTRTPAYWHRTESAITMRYLDRLAATYFTVDGKEPGAVRIEAVSGLRRATYSHLNTFCEISVSGHSKLALKFSPCSGEAIDVLPMDYPVGRPARFAYLDASGVFHVAEARSAEKGPFHDLATGKLERTQPLEITLLDNSHAIASIVLADWAAQLSTALSPTAGWGVPQNSVEFSLDAEHPRSSASIFITLASTSVGRGFDSVGHAPGIYRNRMTIRFLKP